jgi:RNA polymerase sigma factor (TIGR02999 family)
MCPPVSEGAAACVHLISFGDPRRRLRHNSASAGDPAPSMADLERGDVTLLLARWAKGDHAALDALMPVVYAELRKIADAYLRTERTDHTLQPTALVHEAWLRLVRQDSGQFDHRKQFYALAAQMMRRILIDHARTANAGKRGGGAARVALDEAAIGAATPIVELLALNEALDQLAGVSPRQARVIELRYFGGLNVEEMADVLEVSPATISRDQKSAEAWLAQAMSNPRA